MSGIKRFFEVDKQRTSPQKKAKNEILLLSSSEDEDDMVVDVKPAASKSKSPVKPSGRSTSTPQSAPAPAPAPTPASKPAPTPTPRAAAPTPHAPASKPAQVKTEPVKSSPTKSSPASAPAQAQTGPSAKEVLASIPSVDLPSVEPGAKPNFRQIMERQSSQSQGDSGANLDINAAPNCLTGLTFVVTGQLPTLGREEVQGLIKRYGGAVTSSLSGKTSCLVLGEDAGPSKIQKAKQLKLKVIDEAGFISLLEKMPADGGSGEAAEKARLKREREMEQIRQEAAALGKKPASGGKNSGSSSAGANSGGKPAPGGKSASGGSSGGKPEQDDEARDLWTTKYAPKALTDICGNNSSVNRLSEWLRTWRSARNGTYKGDGSMFKAAMLSGPPGIGKTTAAHLVGKLQGYDVIEYNASDTRSKTLLNQQVSQTLNNRSINMGAPNNGTRKIMVIMDEVDGMSGGDRGGVGAMAALARTTNVPLVLICNERTLPKMRPFDRVVFDIQFRRPDESQVRRRLLSIAAVEGLQLDSNAVSQLVAATRSDIRQMLNLLETYQTTSKEMSYDGSRQFSKTWNKEIVLKPFDIAARLLSQGSLSSMSTSERMELYFHDYDFAPLMVEENYLTTSSDLKSAAEAASSISDGDLVDRKIHGPQQQWSLMPLHALLSCVVPGFHAAGQARGRFNFTSYLGNNSKGTKYKRLLAELRSHMRLKLAANAVDLRMELQPLLAMLLLQPLLSKGADAIPEVIEFMDKYYITKEDFDVIMELGVGKPSTEDLAKKLTTQVKSTFTRKYNGMSHPLPFMKTVDTKLAAQPKQTPDLEDVIADDNVDEEANDDPKNDGDDLEKAMKGDKYIKAAKPKAKKAAPKKAAPKKAAPKRK